VSRQLERAQHVAARFSAGSFSHSDLVWATAAADALVACTHDLLPIAVAAKPISVVDLGMPANIPQRFAADPRVRLTRLDDLTRGDAAGLEVAKAIRIVEHEAERFQLWRVGRAQAAA
jgi:glutamyl-tRNA reductase